LVHSTHLPAVHQSASPVTLAPTTLTQASNSALSAMLAATTLQPAARLHQRASSALPGLKTPPLANPRFQLAAHALPEHTPPRLALRSAPTAQLARTCRQQVPWHAQLAPREHTAQHSALWSALPARPVHTAPKTGLL
jgi:hypothetical protein